MNFISYASRPQEGGMSAFRRAEILRSPIHRIIAPVLPNPLFPLFLYSLIPLSPYPPIPLYPYSFIPLYPYPFTPPTSDSPSPPPRCPQIDIQRGNDARKCLLQKGIDIGNECFGHVDDVVGFQVPIVFGNGCG